MPALQKSLNSRWTKNFERKNKLQNSEPGSNQCAMLSRLWNFFQGVRFGYIRTVYAYVYTRMYMYV